MPATSTGNGLKRFGEAGRHTRRRTVSVDYRELLRTRARTWSSSPPGPRRHEPIAIEAARSGAKVIVLEKPMAPSLRDCRAIIDECAGAGPPLIINHERRYDNRYRKVKDMIARGVIGEVKTVHASILTGGHRGGSVRGTGRRPAAP